MTLSFHDFSSSSNFKCFLLFAFVDVFSFLFYFIFLLLVAISSRMWHPFTEVPVRPLKTLLWSTKLLGTYIFALCIWEGLTALVKTATGHSLNYAGCWAPAVYTFFIFCNIPVSFLFSAYSDQLNQHTNFSLLDSSCLSPIGVQC